jgi:hypothetical protein
MIPSSASNPAQEQIVEIQMLHCLSGAAEIQKSLNPLMQDPDQTSGGKKQEKGREVMPPFK